MVPLGEQLLAISRPLALVLITVFSASQAPATMGVMALFAVSAAFFTGTSAVIVEWIKFRRNMDQLAAWLEIVWAASLNAYSLYNGWEGAAQALFFPIIITTALMYDVRLSIGAAAGWLLSNFVGIVNGTIVDVSLYMVINGIGLLFAGCFGVIVRSQRDARCKAEMLLSEVERSRKELERAHRQLKETAEEQKELAALRERERIAREIHDGVAHSLTGLIVQLQVSRRLLTLNPDDSLSAIERSEAMARQALSEVRMAVRTLHSGFADIAAAEGLFRLGRDFQTATGVEVELDVQAEAESSLKIALVFENLYRIFQEALTNAYRHGHASKIRGSISRCGDNLIFAINNNGATPELVEPGFGLRSMAERAELIGGCIEVRKAMPGLDIIITVPVYEGEGGSEIRVDY